MIDMTKFKLVLPKFVSDDSGRQTAFNNGSWGDPSHCYVVSAKNLKKKSINEIIKRAKVFLRTAYQTGTKMPTGIDNLIAINDHCANIVNELAFKAENNNDTYKLATSKYYYLTNYFYYRIHSLAFSY